MPEKLSALNAGRALLPRNIFVLISIRGSVNLRATVRLEGLGTLEKNAITSSGLEPATFQLVA
jgi:uncharacterized membrane protein